MVAMYHLRWAFLLDLSYKTPHIFLTRLFGKGDSPNRSINTPAPVISAVVSVLRRALYTYPSQTMQLLTKFYTGADRHQCRVSV